MMPPILDEFDPVRGGSDSSLRVLFDGWEEMSISASEGFRIRIETTLRKRYASG